MTAVQLTLLGDVEASREALDTITCALQALQRILEVEPRVLLSHVDEALGILHLVWDLREKRRVKDATVGTLPEWPLYPRSASQSSSTDCPLSCGSVVLEGASDSWRALLVALALGDLWSLCWWSSDEQS